MSLTGRGEFVIREYTLLRYIVCYFPSCAQAATAGTDDEHALQSSDDADNPEMTNAGKAAAAGGGGGGDVGEGGGHAGRAGVGGPGARGGGRASSSSPEGGDVIAAEEMEKFDFAALQRCEGGCGGRAKGGRRPCFDFVSIEDRATVE